MENSATLNDGNSQVPKQAPDRLEVLAKIEEYERDGKFDIDVENDPPQTRVLEPGEVDYERKKISSKIRRFFAYRMASKFLKKMLKTRMIQIKDIKGKENIQNLKTGAILTCNHFSAFDSFATQIAFESCKMKKRKLYRVIREGNYTDFPGLFGFIMRNYNTLPLSENKRVMMEFYKATNNILKKNDFVLIYPEQSMWWNYRKPKPLKDGAFKFAVRNNVPVVPIFVTMEDSDVIGPDGFPVQQYTINIEAPIYPDKEKDFSENVAEMKEKNSTIWKNVYEEFYKQPLTYETKK